MSEIKRNPARNETSHGKFVSYQPEHERLNREPSIIKTNTDDFAMYNQQQSKRRRPQNQPVKNTAFVHSGQNEDQLFSLDEEPTWNEDILDNEIPSPTTSYVSEEIEDDVFNENEGFFGSIPCGDYVLVSNDQAILVGSKEEIESAILDIASSDGEAFKTLSVFRKMSVKVGVLVSDE